MIFDQNAPGHDELFLKFWIDSQNWDYCANRFIDTDVLRQMINKERKMLDEAEKTIELVENLPQSQTVR